MRIIVGPISIFEELLISAVATGELCPLTGYLFPPFWFTENAVFLTLLNDKTTDNDEKTNNYVQTYFSFDVFSILRKIAGNQLLCH